MRGWARSITRLPALHTSHAVHTTAAGTMRSSHSWLVARTCLQPAAVARATLLSYYVCASSSCADVAVGRHRTPPDSVAMPVERPIVQQPQLHVSPPDGNTPTARSQQHCVLGASSSPSSLFSPSAPTPPTPRSRAIARPSVDSSVLCLLLLGVGCTLSWTAVVFGSSVYYSERYGRASLLYLSAAVYVPGVLVAALHAAVDGWMYRRLGAVRWTQLRMWGGLLLVILFTLAIPCIPDDTSSQGKLLLYVLTFCLGAACAVPNCCSLDIVSSMRKHYIVALTAGTQLSGLICLALTFVTGLNQSTSGRIKHRLFMVSIAVTTAASLCAAVMLQYKSPPWQYVMGRRDFFSKRAVKESEASPLLTEPDSGTVRWQLNHTTCTEETEHESDGDDDSTESMMLFHSDTVHSPAPSPQLARHIGDAKLLPAASSAAPTTFLSTFRLVWQPFMSLFLTASTSVMLASLYSFAPSTTPNLLLVLVYLRLTLDLFGRLVLLLPFLAQLLSHSSRSNKVLLVAAVVRAVIGVVVFCTYLVDWLSLNDALVCALIGLLSLSSGLFCTLSYQYAAVSVSGINRSSAAHWMNLSFQGSILAGLMAGFIVRFTLLRNQ